MKARDPLQGQNLFSNLRNPGLAECSSGFARPEGRGRAMEEEPRDETIRPWKRVLGQALAVTGRAVAGSEMEHLRQRVVGQLHKSDTYGHEQECHTGPKLRATQMSVTDGYKFIYSTGHNSA